MTLTRDSRWPARPSAAWLLVALVMLLLVPPRAGGQEAETLRPVILAPVRQEEITDRIEVLGTLQPNERVVLAANVTERIEALHFEEGQSVAAGDLLVVLQQDEERAMIRAAEAVRDERQSAFDRTRQLSERDFAATSLLDERRAALEQAEAELQVARARLQDRNLRAPFAGRIGLRQVSPGTLVEPGDPIVTLSDISRLKLTMTVPSRFLARLQPGLPIRARAQAFPERVFEGTVDVVDTAIDPVTRTAGVRALIPNDEGSLRPGLLMEVDLLANRRTALLVPEEALVPEGRRAFVFVAGGLNGEPVRAGAVLTVERREIAVGARRPGAVAVLEGLAPGQAVVVHGATRIADGESVRVLGVIDDDTSVADILGGS
jgi:membrane fusion protein (multidrug efflux system)